jgi:hypothetical protein
MLNFSNQDILKDAAKYRGWILNGTIALERLIDVYLACYFSPYKSKRDELVDLVFAASGGMPFEPKRNIFAILLKKHHKEFHNNNKAFLEDLSYIIKQRNVLAHYLTDRSDEAIQRFKDKSEVGFIRFKEVTETVYYSEDVIKSIIDKIEKCIVIMQSLLPSEEDYENAPL